MTDETSTEQAASFEDPVARAGGPTGPGGYPGDPQTADGDLGGPEGGDDLDRFIAEQMQDPAFVRAWNAGQAREVDAAYRRGLAEGQRLRTGQVDALTRGAYEDGKSDGRAEGRRQVTADWKREWGIRYADGAPVGAEESEAEARRVADLWGWPYTAVSRVVGPWEDAEQDGGDRDQ